MAIGDKPNSNLFGTDYNAEEEERKRLEAEASSAAQSAMMGAGGVPSTALGQAAASNLFSTETAGQVNPMIQEQNLGATTQAPVTFLPYADDVSTPSASALSVFTPGGEVKPNVDVNAITPSPEILPSPSSVNTALNQSVAVGSPSQEPGYFQRVGQFAKSALNRDQGLFDVDRLSTAADDLLGSAMRNLTPVEDRKFANNEPFGKTVTDIFAITKPDGTKFYPDAVEPDATSTQGQQETLGVDQAAQDGTGTSLSGTEEKQESPKLEIRRGEEGSPQGYFNAITDERPLTPEEIKLGKAFADRKGFDFNPQTGFSTITDPGSKTFDTPATRENFRNRGLSLGQFMRYEDDPSKRTEQFVDEQGRLRRRLTPGAAALQDFKPGQQPLAPEFAQAEATGDQMIADLRAEEAAKARGREGPSMRDLRNIAKANMRGASQGEVARGMKSAADHNLDFRTGQPLPEAPQAPEGLTFDQQLSLRKQNFAEGKFDYELAKDAKATYAAGIEASQKATTEEAQADTAGRTMVSAINNMNDAMTRMGGRSGEFFGSGFFGKASSFIPGTSAYDQVADVEFLQSNVALNAMSELKELSPTGSTGFGALSEKELRVLTDKYANLNPFTSPELFQSNLKQLQGEFNNMLNNAWNKHSKEYSPEAANAIYGNRGGSASGATGTPGQAVPNDRDVATAVDTLLSDPKYNK